MENLNAEQIKKALECCVKAETHLDCRKLKCPALINDECIYIGETDEDCDRQQLADALALITSQEQRINELTEENERLREKADRHLDNLKAVLEERRENTIVADTVREMQERLQAYFGTYVLGYKIPISEALKALNQIAKEVLGQCEIAYETPLGKQTMPNLLSLDGDIAELYKQIENKIKADIVKQFAESLEKPINAYINVSRDETLEALVWCLELVEQKKKCWRGRNEGTHLQGEKTR